MGRSLGRLIRPGRLYNWWFYYRRRFCWEMNLERFEYNIYIVRQGVFRIVANLAGKVQTYGLSRIFVYPY